VCCALSMPTRGAAAAHTAPAVCALLLHERSTSTDSVLLKRMTPARLACSWLVVFAQHGVCVCVCVWVLHDEQLAALHCKACCLTQRLLKICACTSAA
jgi:hypothetical protein